MGRSYQFTEYRIDPASRELWRGQQLIVLPPHVFDVLAYLVERDDRAVSRDELVAAVWGKSEVSDTLLGQTVLRIRRELGDDAKEQRILRTIPRFGYRWVAPTEVKDSAIANGAQTEGVASKAAPIAKPTVITNPGAAMGVGALVAVAFLAGIWLWQRSTSSPQPATTTLGVQSLTNAVLPATVEPGVEWGWMRLGVMDVVATRLRTSGLPSVPSEDIVALLNAPAANRGSVREATAAHLLVSPHVHRSNVLWQVNLDADDASGQHYAVEASASDVIQAARDATDKLLVVLGRRPTENAGEATPYAVLVKRVDAAVLADDPDAARALIAQASLDEQRSPELRLRLAKIDFRAGRLDAARERLVTLLEEAPPKTAPLLRASVLNGLGAVAIRDDKPQQASLAFGEAIDLLTSLAEPAQLGQAYLGRAAVAENERHFEAAAADYARARVALRQANDTLALVRVAANEGFLDLDQGRPAQALPQLVASTDGFKQWGALNEAIFTYIGQISCYLALLDGHAAMQAADAADSLAQRIDNPSTLASLTIARAKALVATGRLREARGLLDRLRSNNPDPVTTAAAGVVLARLELESNNVAAAGELAEHAIAVLDAPSYDGPRAEAWLTRIRSALRSADSAGTAALIATLETWAGQTDERRARLFARLARAEYAVRSGMTWRGDFDTALDLAVSDAIPSEIVAVTKSYTDALMADGDLERAAVEVGRVSRWSDQDFDCAVLEARLYAALGRNEARQTALGRARGLAGERSIPADALAVAISTRAASVQ